MIWTLLAGVVAVVLFVFVPFTIFDRRQEREENEWQRKHLVEMNAYVEQMSLEVKSRRELEKKLSAMKWPEVRALCESETGRVCECATRWQAAQNVWWARHRRGLT
jgi:hypothetical protein